MQDYYDRVEKITEFIKSKSGLSPKTAVVLGSGLGGFASEIEEQTVIPFTEIPDFPVSTVKGHAGRLIFGKLFGKDILAMQGRFHRYEGYDMKDVTLYVRVMFMLGIKYLVLTNAAGGINTDFVPGDLMLITDHFSLFCQNPLFRQKRRAFRSAFSFHE